MIERRPITSRNEWLAWRAPLLTASDIAAAAGISPFNTPLDLYLEKLGMKPPRPETGAMRRGRHMEGAALEYLKEQLPGWRVVRPNVFLIDHENRIGATPDALLEDPDEPGELVNCQVKVVAQQTHTSWGDSPPLHYFYQVVCENLLLDASSGLLAVLAVSSHDAELHTYTVPRNENAERTITEVAHAFWSLVANRTPPAADYARDTDAIRLLYPPDPSRKDERPLDLHEHNRLLHLLDARTMMKKEAGELSDTIKAFDNEIIEILNGAPKAIAGPYKITRTTRITKEHWVKAFESTPLIVTRSEPE